MESSEDISMNLKPQIEKMTQHQLNTIIEREENKLQTKARLMKKI